MKESAFRKAVLSHLPKAVHCQPMIAGMTGVSGTPDTYIDYKRDLWVEWKVLPNEDRLPELIPARSLPTELQHEWLHRRYTAGKNALVIVGVKLRSRAWGFVLDSPSMWSRLPRDRYEPLLRPAPELAAYLLEKVS